MDLFWQSENYATGQDGFGLFSPAHLIALVILAGVATLLTRAYLHAEAARRHRIRATIAWTVVVLELVKDLALIVTGQWLWANLPLNLCSWGIPFIALDVVRPGPWSRTLLYSLTLPGAAMAVLTPDWARSPILNAFVWHSFVMHLLLSTYVIMRLVAREMTPSARDLWRSVVFLAVVVPPTALVNHALGTNFFFLSVPVPGSPLAPVHQMFGGFYLVGLALLLVVFWTPMYLPWGIVRLRQGLTVRARAVTVS